MKKGIGIIIFLVLVQYNAFADGYWLELTGSGHRGDTLFIKIRYGGVDEQKHRYIKSGTALDKMNGFHLYIIDNEGKKKTIPIQQFSNYWEGCYTPKANGSYRILAIDSTLPVVERSDTLQNIKPIQYLCSLYQVGNTNRVITNDQYLDLIANINNNTVQIKSFIGKNKIENNHKLRIFYPGNHDESLDIKNNTSELLLKEKGMYLIRLDWVEKKKGILNRKRFYSIRHRCDYTLYNR
ncbi:MAG: hypothetical protein DI598_04515 [Pseudopedobacter saltans]|uniref:Uncharacterized protein n=1 Tax=Pseudopedobacter saltans TaxID=151895 RepID=A0A2W5F9L3_9SPHI|nr:MAG: hypothetical protein DI598_04515 [Pseudopedobacter saltans]